METFPFPHTYTKCPYFSSFAIHPLQPDIRYLGSYEVYDNPSGALYQSTDGGTTWHLILQHEGAPTAIKLHPDTPSTILVGFASSMPQLDRNVLGGTVIQSTDNGMTWRTLSTGLMGRGVYSITSDFFNPDKPYLGAYGGVYTQELWYGTYLPLTHRAPP